MPGRQPGSLLTLPGAGLRPEVRLDLLRALARTPRGLWITCAGRSMEPTVALGDRLRIHPCQRVWPGDVVLFQASRALVLHRVLAPVPGTPYFLHIGDAGSPDAPGLARRDAVIGRATVPRRAPRRLLPARTYAQALARLTRAAHRAVHRAAHRALRTNDGQGAP